ncbi:Trm112 family protein [Phycisphaera mikurensis]|uniref:Uncharacterized protein n=1 Tax=Phycisphaera mikurensis (strain NBRC 102666 / KCTC 22515 / FYK2301M01) TaxID=1142394 RepID=I0IHP8_PHYMF|nr:hypothetical protein [Phycisphaera mikurensis]MBB6441031.1 hypothetical protein [Phycisphaera mikurensis]BAM04786.1 hypothetical protein PSMK_26270 [Phycisphaera mikurensis NBRC 102666]
MAAPVDPALLSLLVCPLTRSALRQEGDTLIATKPEGAGLRYRVREGIPVMLMDEAELPDGFDDLAAFIAAHRDDVPDPERLGAALAGEDHGLGGTP